MKERYSELTKDILVGIAVAGAIAVAATSPYFLLNIAKATLGRREELKKKLERKKIKRMFEKLRKNRLVILREENGKFAVELTEKGQRKVKEIQFERLEIKKPAAWDKKWRVVIFDIPKKKRAARDALRRKLKELDFYPLQKSVWVCPYPCEQEIQFISELFEIGPYVNILVAEKIFEDGYLRKYFKLFD